MHKFKMFGFVGWRSKWRSFISRNLPSSNDAWITIGTFER